MNKKQLKAQREKQEAANNAGLEGMGRVQKARVNGVDAWGSNALRNIVPLPNNVSSYLMREAGLPVKFDKNSYTPAQRKVIYDATINAINRKGWNNMPYGEGIEYKDYEGTTDPETYGHIINELQKKNMNKLKGAWHGATEPAYNVASTLGRFSYGFDPITQQVSVFDNYNFKNPDAPKTPSVISENDPYKGYKKLRRELGQEDEAEIEGQLSPKYGSRFVISPQDTISSKNIPNTHSYGDMLGKYIAPYQNGGQIMKKKIRIKTVPAMQSGGYNPMTAQQRDAWNMQQIAARQQGFIGDEHSKEPGNQFMQSQGMDPNQLAAYQADLLEQRNTSPWGKRPGAYMTPGAERDFSPADSHYGKDTAREMYLNYNVQGKPFGTDWKAATAYSGQLEAARQKEWENFGKPEANINYQAPVTTPTVPTTPKPTGLAATGFPTREEAIAKYKTRKASGQELPSNYFLEDTKRQKRMKETGDPIGMVRSTGEDVYAYGGPILGGFDARLNQNYPYPMTNQYPHKIGGQYHPYDHTRMEMGGSIPFANGGEAGTNIQVDKNKFKMLSPYTAEVGGEYHSNGGTDIMSNGQRAEAEKKETLHIQPDGTAIVGGNLYVPGTNTKFKDAFKDVAKGERQTSKVQDKASKFLNEYGSEGIGAKNKYQSPAFNYGVVMSDNYEQSKAKDEFVKNSLTDLQNKMLELGGMIDPENGAKKVSGMFKGKAKWGANMMAKKGKALKKFNPMANAVEFNTPTSTPGAWQSTTEPMNIQYPSQQAPQSLLVPDNQRSSNDPNDFADNKNYKRRAERENAAWIKMQEEEGGLSPDSPISKTAITNFPGESGIAKAIAVDKQDKEFIKSLGKDTSKENDKKKVQGLRNKFRITDYIPEIVAGFERADPYQSMQVQPYLESEYNVSFQNEKNAIQSAFAPAMKAARTAGERAAIAAQMAEQLQNVDAKEFQFNQQNTGGIKARNIQEMRGVRDTNLKLGMDAYEKTLGAEEAARQIGQSAGESVSAKEAARRAKNLELAMYEDYAGWAYNPAVKERWEMLHPGQVYDPRTISLADLYEDDEKKTVKKKKKDSKGKESEEETVTTTESYYGGPMAYFGIDMPASIQRTYFGGGAVGGGAMAMGAGQSMQGLPGQAGFMASHYFPGGNGQNKKKKKRTT